MTGLLPTLSSFQPSLVTVSRLWLVIGSWLLEPIPEVVLEHYCLWLADNCWQSAGEMQMRCVCLAILKWFLFGLVWFCQTIHFLPVISLRCWGRGGKSLCLRCPVPRPSVAWIVLTQTLFPLLSHFPDPLALRQSLGGVFLLSPQVTSSEALADALRNASAYSALPPPTPNGCSSTITQLRCQPLPDIAVPLADFPVLQGT